MEPKSYSGRKLVVPINYGDHKKPIMRCTNSNPAMNPPSTSQSGRKKKMMEPNLKSAIKITPPCSGNYKAPDHDPSTSISNILIINIII